MVSRPSEYYDAVAREHLDTILVATKGRKRFKGICLSMLHWTVNGVDVHKSTISGLERRGWIEQVKSTGQERTWRILI